MCRRKGRMMVALSLLMVLAISSSMTHAALTTKDSIDFDVKTEMGVLPSSDGWTFATTRGDHEPSEFAVDATGSYVTQTNGWGDAHYERTDVDFENGFTIEWRVRPLQVDKTDGTGAFKGLVLLLRDQGYQWDFASVFEDEMAFDNNQTYTFQESIKNEWATFRIAIETNNTWHVYMNDAELGTITPGRSASDDSLLYFGALSHDEDTESADWDYIRFTDSGAFAPIPEPTTMALLLTGGFAVACRRKND